MTFRFTIVKQMNSQNCSLFVFEKEDGKNNVFQAKVKVREKIRLWEKKSEREREVTITMRKRLNGYCGMNPRKTNGHNTNLMI